MKTLKVDLRGFPGLDGDKLSNLASEFYGKVMETTAQDHEVLIEFYSITDGLAYGFTQNECWTETNMNGFARAIQSFKE